MEIINDYIRDIIRISFEKNIIEKKEIKKTIINLIPDLESHKMFNDLFFVLYKLEYLAYIEREID